MRAIASWIGTASACVVLAACATRSNVQDLDRFIARRDTCDHLRGEFPEDATASERQAFVATIKDACGGTDAELARLRDRYRNDPASLGRLAPYETRIEATPRS